MADKMRLAKQESRCGLISHSRDIAPSDEFWEAIRDADNAFDAGDLEAVISATERADTRSILKLACLPDPFLKSVVEFLPLQASPGPRGGRRPIAYEVILKVIWYVLTVGCRWKDIPPEMGCSGDTARLRLKCRQDAGVWQRVYPCFLQELKRRGVLKLETALVESVQVRVLGGGDRSGPSPVDRRKLGTKYTLQVEARGVPLAEQSAAANVSDQRQILSTEIRGTPGRPRRHPQGLVDDAGSDSDGTRALSEFWGSNHYH